MEFIKFIFSSFWIWLGFTVLVCCVLKYLVDLVSALHPTRKITVRDLTNSRSIEIQNASYTDLMLALDSEDENTFVEVVDNDD